MPRKQPQRKPADDDGVLLPILAAVLSCILLFIGASVAYGVWHTSTADSRSMQQETETPEESPSAPQIRAIAQDGSVIYNLPCGMELTYYDSVPGDVTGRWRSATTSFGSSPSNYAAEYYNNVFSSDDEIHAICDPILGTTTRIMVDQNRLLVDTLKYVEGEEQDAKILFSGDALRSKVFDKQTGKSIKTGEEDKPSPEPAEESPSPSASPSQSTAQSVSPSPSSAQTASTSPAPSSKPTESQAPASQPAQSDTPQTPVGNDRKSKFASGQVLATTESNNGGNPVYHTWDCSAAKKIAEESELWYESEQAAKADGRNWCGICSK